MTDRHFADLVRAYHAEAQCDVDAPDVSARRDAARAVLEVLDRNPHLYSELSHNTLVCLRRHSSDVA